MHGLHLHQPQGAYCTDTAQMDWSIYPPRALPVWSPSSLETQAQLCFLDSARKVGTHQFQPPLLSTISHTSVFREDLWSPATFTSTLCPGKPAEKKMHLGFLYMDSLLRTVHLASLTNAGNRCEYQGHSAILLLSLGFTTVRASSLHWSEVVPAQKELSRGCELPSRLKRADSENTARLTEFE